MSERLVFNVFCMLIMFILLLSIGLQKTKDDKATERFSIMMHMVIGYLATNTVSDIIMGKPEYNIFSYVINTMGFLWIDAVIITFSAYLQTLTRKVKDKWKLIMNPAVFFTYIRIVIVLILSFTGNLFLITEDGQYEELPLSVIPYCITAIVLVTLLFVVIGNRRYFTLKQIVVIVVYLLLPIPGMALEMKSEMYSLTSISLTLSVLLVYVMIQANIIAKGRARESVLEEISATDLLTDVGNRRAYYDRLSLIKPKQQIGVMFCDINGLKYVNDNFGHVEGDKRIVCLVKLFAKVFDEKDIFRISGDEFVILIANISKEVFTYKVEQFRKSALENNNIASLGYAYGTGDCVEQLVSLAEGNMYDNKRAYYNTEEGRKIGRRVFDT